MYNPTFSIITVCRNALPILQQTVASVRTQSFNDYEHIIIDGASTDGTIQWLTTQQQIEWISESDKGIYDAMNKGVKLAHGEWIIFMNAGDTLYDKEVLNRIYPILQKGYGMVYGDIVKEKKGKFITKHAELPHNTHRMFFCHQALFTRRELLLKEPFDISLRLSADYKFVKQMYKQRTKMLYVPQIIACFDTNGMSNTHLIDGLKENIRIIKELDNNIFERILFISKLRYKILWTTLRNLI